MALALGERKDRLGQDVQVIHVGQAFQASLLGRAFLHAQVPQDVPFDQSSQAVQDVRSCQPLLAALVVRPDQAFQAVQDIQACLCDQAHLQVQEVLASQDGASQDRHQKAPMDLEQDRKAPTSASGTHQKAPMDLEQDRTLSGTHQKAAMHLEQDTKEQDKTAPTLV